MTRIIGILSGKGGVGKTTLVANLGTVLSMNFNKNVVVVDCNITSSHLALYLGVYYYPVTINEVLVGKLRIDGAIQDIRGLKVIPASLTRESLRGVDISKLKEKVKDLRGKAEIVLLDAAPGIGREALSVARASDEVIFVTTPHVPSVTDCLRLKKVCLENEIKITGIVMNMVTKAEYELTNEEIERITELPVLCSIPFSRDVLRSLGLKLPIVVINPHSKVSQQFFKLACLLLGIEYKPPSLFKRIKSLFGL
jgi:septum site-determining protein MinD